MTPFSMAFFIISSRESIFLSFIIPFIIAVPMPPMFILESLSLPAPLGSITPNILSIKLFFTFTLLLFLRAVRPQNVKNIVTGRPIASAPLAITKLASTLSISPSNTIIVLPFALPDSTSFRIGNICVPLRIAAVYSPFRCSLLTRVFPVRLHHEAMSLANPGSDAVTSRISPSFIVLTDLNTSIIGPGHCIPQQSSLILLTALPTSCLLSASFPGISALSFFSSLPLSALSSSDGKFAA